MIIGRDVSGKPTTSSNSPNTALAARMTEGCTNPNCKAKKRSTHTTSNCYWPGGKEGQFPPNFGQRTRANAAASATTTTTTTTPTPAVTTSQPEHFVLSVQIPDTPGQSGVLIEEVIDEMTEHPPMALISKGFQKFQKGKTPTFLDSGASNTMFISKDAFTNYKPVVPRKGDSAKAKDGDFEIIGEGNVVQRYQVEGKDRQITIPMLSIRQR